MGYFTSKLFVVFLLSHPHFTSRQKQKKFIRNSGAVPFKFHPDRNPIIRAHSTREHLAGIVDDTTNLFVNF